MNRDTVRLQCLKLALEKRAGISTAATIIEDAKLFETYVNGADTAGEKAPVPAPARKDGTQDRAASRRN